AEFEALVTEVEADPSVGIALGAESAPVEIMEFADYSCPHCANFAGFAGKLLRQNYVEGGGPVRWVLYDYVLGTFPHSVAAHVAARCAGEQGLYWPMHDLLLARQAGWARGGDPMDAIASIAEEVGVEMGPYRECMGEGRPLPSIAASRKYGQDLGVSSTPTLFVNGRKIDLTGREPYSYVESLIQAELDEDADSAETTGSGS
ncbi:MAG: thioredoxin domain-containing protein, partial [Gemmatimonadota bacterium]|nr:thioredoxin domain-containing protein [Gemmatimonadota bacterium]